MSGIVLYTPTVEEVQSGELGRRMREFNYQFVGEYPQVQPVWLNARDEAGQVVAGLRGFVFLEWFTVDVLFVESAHRRSGIGSRILREGEQRATGLGATRAKLETFEWQARAFYEKQGYEQFASIDGYMKEYALFYMGKSLAG